MYYRLAFEQNELNRFTFKINRSDSDMCRFCQNHVENVNHIMTGCHNLDYDDLKLACARENVKFEVSNLLIDTRVKYYVELFLKKYFVK